MPPLPSEIIDKIIDEVYLLAQQNSWQHKALQKKLFECEFQEDPFHRRRGPNYAMRPSLDTTDIHSCSLVCKAWLPRSRFHLFDKFVVYSSPRFEQRLSIFSALAPDLRHFALGHSPGSWHYGLLPRLTIFGSLTSMEIYSARFADPETGALAEIFKHFSMLQHLAFVSCVFRHWAQIFSTLCACRNLESLIFTNSDFIIPALPCSTGQPLPRLRSLCISRTNFGLLQWIMMSHPAPQLRILRIPIYFHDHVPIVAEVLRIIAPSLEYLHLGFSGSKNLPDALYRNSGLRDNHQLRTVRLAIPSSDRNSLFHPDYIHSILGQISSSLIREVVLEGRMNMIQSLDCMEFSEMERVFAQPNFAGLRGVRFQLGPYMDLEIASEFLKQRLPGCYSRGIIVVERGALKVLA